jgi:transposase InsO family protein
VKARGAELSVRFARFEIKKPQNLAGNKELPQLVTVNIIYAKEEHPPKGLEPIERFLMTNDDVNSVEQAVEKARYYAQRWKIEMFHYVLKSGSEFARRREIAAQHNAPVYFADPHSPRQRGTNENINGLIRWFFPKGTDFSKITKKELKRVIDLIDNRPRKRLGWLSPLEFLARLRCT